MHQTCVWIWFVQVYMPIILHIHYVHPWPHKHLIFLHQFYVGVTYFLLHIRVIIIHQMCDNNPLLVNIFCWYKVWTCLKPLSSPLYFLGKLCSFNYLHLFSMHIHFINIFQEWRLQLLFGCEILPQEHFHKGSCNSFHGIYYTKLCQTKW